MILHSVVFPSPLGEVWCNSTEKGIAYIGFSEFQLKPQQKFKHPDTETATTLKNCPHLLKLQTQLQMYFNDAKIDIGFQFDVPIDLECHQATPFQLAVWKQLQTIPPKITRTYSEIAQAIGKPKAVRAVGGAVGKNPISIVLPCHRILGKSGTLTGYSGGIQRKIELLHLENMSNYTSNGIDRVNFDL